MLFGYLTLATALIISLSAAVYSILGLTAIFAAAFWPIVIMGGSLEIGKIITTLWLHKYWSRAEIQYKVYLCSAVAVLMLLTSMGVFGFLSKAHTDQGLVSGDVTSKIAIYDEKIKIEKDNVDANRRDLKQMDEAVDQVMARSTTEGGADKAVTIRRSQQKERSRILSEIADSQKKITNLNEQRAPIAAEVRKVDAEVGPIKYIAALIYGDNADANVLEKSVRWVIILIVAVFDPLALTLLLAATKTFEWEHNIDLFNLNKKREEEDKEETDRILKQGVTNSDPDAGVPLSDDIPVFEREEIPLEEPMLVERKSPFKGKGVQPGMPLTASYIQPTVEEKIEEPIKEEETPAVITPVVDDHLLNKTQQIWVASHPGEDINTHHQAHQAGEIDRLPWHDPDYINGLPLSDSERKQLLKQAQQSIDEWSLKADNTPSGPVGEVKGFGTTFPINPLKGDMFIRVDQLPSALYKFNGQNWILVPKELSDSHAYDDSYIDHLIDKIITGEFDPELLTDAERASIEERLKIRPV